MVALVGVVGQVAAGASLVALPPPQAVSSAVKSAAASGRARRDWLLNMASLKVA